MGASVLHIKTEIECIVYLFDEEKGIATPGKYFNLEVRKGEQDLVFVSTVNDNHRFQLLYFVEDNDCDYSITIEKAKFNFIDKVDTSRPSEKEISNGFRDEYGVIYSQDGSQLLTCNNYKLDSYQVRSGCLIIRDWAFFNKQISKIFLPSSLTHIGKWAFGECKKLMDINLPMPLHFIGECAFFKSGIHNIISNSPYFTYDNGLLIDTNEKKVISYCSYLHSVTIPDYIKSIERLAFVKCNQLNHINLNNGLSEIGSGAFSECVCFKEITLPPTLVHIGHSAFSDTKIRKVVSHSPNFKFENGCLIDTREKKLVAFLSDNETVILPEGIESIGRGAFGKRNNPTNIYIPEGLTTIDDGAFWECFRLTNITLPNSLRHIGHKAFWRCNIDSINLPIELNHIEDDAFMCGIPNRIIIPYGSKNHFESMLPEDLHNRLIDKTLFS